MRRVSPAGAATMNVSDRPGISRILPVKSEHQTKNAATALGA
jgi:hypothetical protein